MHYTVKSKDNLTKISKEFNIPKQLILSFNPQIINPNKLFVDQVLYIPNISDIPEKLQIEVTTNAHKIIERAKSAINNGIKYKLGEGGLNPNISLPTTNKLCDCSGFVCWVVGLSRKSEIPFYKKHGGWIYTDSIVADINSNAGIFEKIRTPEPGCIVVYGAGSKIGHTGIVSKVSNGLMEKVIHCSSGNDKKFKDSIQETTPEVFNRADTVFGRFII